MSRVNETFRAAAPWSSHAPVEREHVPVSQRRCAKCGAYLRRTRSPLATLCSPCEDRTGSSVPDPPRTIHEAAYRLRADAQLPWNEIASQIGVETAACATKLASRWAAKTGAEWPVDLGQRYATPTRKVA